jgi:Ni/Fe-hydrogenase subunit HybB-like protein
VSLAVPPPQWAPPSLPPTRWIDGDPSLGQITKDVARPMEGRPGRGWWICLAIALGALVNLKVMIAFLFARGIGIWGLNNAVGWAFDITNFVFWVGIGHAGTLISAILLLFRQKWRTSINRSAEAMTIFAVMCAGLFPLIHMGRPWDAFFILPYFPNQRGPLWVNFRSPLVWDVFAISTYLTISLVFWYLGMIPDLATLRDRARDGLRKKLFALLSLGWNGSHRTWSRYEIVSLILAGLATPLVLSVHSIVSMDFATSLLPGWHATIFPPYFVAGAIYSGFGMVLMLLIITRQTMHLQRYITLRHLEAMAKVTLLTGSIVGYAYATEFFSAWYGGNVYERFHFINRATGPYAWCFYLMVICNVVAPQALWWKRARRSVALLFAISILVNVGMWCERFVIIVVSLHRSFLPSSWGMFIPTKFDVGILVGSFGLFFTCFLLFIRFLPMIAMWEIKGVAGEAQPGEAPHAAP